MDTTYDDKATTLTPRRKKGFQLGNKLGRGSTEQARKAHETKQRRAAEAKHAGVVERVVAVTAERLIDRALAHTDVAIEYAAAVAAGHEKGDKLRLQAAGLLLGLGHAAAPKRILQASLSIQAILDKPDSELLAEVMRALPEGMPLPRLHVEHSTPAFTGQESDIFD